MKHIKKFEQIEQIEEGDLVVLLSHNKWTEAKGFVIGRKYEIFNVIDAEYPYQISDDRGEMVITSWVKADQIEKV